MTEPDGMKYDVPRLCVERIRKWLRERAEREAYLWRCSTCGRQMTTPNMTEHQRRNSATIYNGMCPRPHCYETVPGFVLPWERRP